jgi:hypothetical protein
MDDFLVRALAPHPAAQATAEGAGNAKQHVAGRVVSSKTMVSKTRQPAGWSWNRIRPWKGVMLPSSAWFPALKPR